MTALTTEFEAHANSLSASLPSELGALTGLKSWFRLDSNSFTGEVYIPRYITTASPIRHRFYDHPHTDPLVQPRSPSSRFLRSWGR